MKSLTPGRWYQVASLLRRARIALVTATAGLLIAASIGTAQDQQSGNDLRWFYGVWKVGYVDNALGPVSGIVRTIGDRTDLYLLHPKTGATYRLQSYKITPSSTQLEILFEGKSPPSGLPAETEVVAPPVAGAKALPIPVGSRVTAKVAQGKDEAPAVADDVPPRLERLRLVFEVPSEGPIEQLDGQWSYEVRDARDMRYSRAGAYDSASRLVSGSEAWARLAPPVIHAVRSGDELTSPLKLREALDDPKHYLHDNATRARNDYPPDGIGRMWLTIYGVNLPAEPRRRVEFAIEDPNAVYTGVYRSWGENSMQVEIVLREGLDDKPKRVTLNGAPGIWYPDLANDEPTSIQYVRRKSESEFETVDTLYLGDVFFVEATYAGAPYTNRKRLATLDLNKENIEYPVDRLTGRAKGQPELYRSGPLLVLEPFAQIPGKEQISPSIYGEAGAGPEPVIIWSQDGEKLETSDVELASSQPAPANATAPAQVVAVAAVKDHPPTLWEQALARAQACRDKGAKTEATNYIVTDALSKATVAELATLGVLGYLAKEAGKELLTEEGGKLRRTIGISLEDHAAAILLRDEMNKSLDAHAEKLNKLSPVDYNAKPDEVKRQETMWRNAQLAEVMGLIASAQGKLPPSELLKFPVSRPSGVGRKNTAGETVGLVGYYVDALRPQAGYTLGDSLHISTLIFTYDNDFAAFLAYARKAVDEAKGAMLERTAQASKRSQKADECDVVEVLKLIGVGTKPIAKRLVPQLLRPSSGTEPLYPRYVPDTEARQYVGNIGILAEAVGAQSDYSKLDKDAIIAALTAPALIATAGIGAAHIALTRFGATAAANALMASNAVVQVMQASKVVMTAAEIYDLYAVGRDTLGYVEAQQDVEFGYGIAGVAGTERLTAAQAQADSEFWSVAMSASLGVLPNAIEGMAAGKIEIPSWLGGKVQEGAMRHGLDALPPDQRAIFDRMAANARAKLAASRPGDLTPEELAVLAMANAHAAGRPTGPVGNAARPPISKPPAQSAEPPAVVAQADPTGASSTQPVPAVADPTQGAISGSDAATKPGATSGTQATKPDATANSITGTLDSAKTTTSNVDSPTTKADAGKTTSGASTATGGTQTAAVPPPIGNKPSSTPDPSSPGGTKKSDASDKPSTGGGPDGGTTSSSSTPSTRPQKNIASADAGTVPGRPDSTTPSKQPAPGSTTVDLPQANAANADANAGKSTSKPASPPARSKPGSDTVDLPQPDAKTADADTAGSAPSDASPKSGMSGSASADQPPPSSGTGSASGGGSAPPSGVGSANPPAGSSVAEAPAPSDTGLGNQHRPTLDDEDAAAEADAALWRQVFNAFRNSDLARSFLDDTLSIGPYRNEPRGPAVGGSGYVYQAGDFARVADFLNRNGLVPEESLGRVAGFWRAAGMRPEDVMAGHAFWGKVPPSATGLSPDQFHASLDRFLRDHLRIGDPAERARLIDKTLARFGDDAPPVIIAKADADPSPLPEPGAAPTKVLPPREFGPLEPDAATPTKVLRPDKPDAQATQVLPPREFGSLEPDARTPTKVLRPNEPKPDSASSDALPSDLPSTKTRPPPSDAGPPTTKSDAPPSDLPPTDTRPPSSDTGPPSTKTDAPPSDLPPTATRPPSSDTGPPSTKTDAPPSDLPPTATRPPAGSGPGSTKTDLPPSDLPPTVTRPQPDSGPGSTRPDARPPDIPPTNPRPVSPNAGQSATKAGAPSATSGSSGDGASSLSGRPEGSGSPSEGPIIPGKDVSSVSASNRPNGDDMFVDIKLDDADLAGPAKPNLGPGWKAEVKPIEVPPTVKGDWQMQADGSLTFKGRPVSKGKFLNEVFDTIVQHVNPATGWVKVPGGRFADVHALVDGNGAEVGYASKTLGERRNWHHNDITGQWYREDFPMAEPDPAIRPWRARKMVETTVHGAAVAEQLDVPVLDIIGYNLSGPTPGYVQRQINRNLDQLPPRKDGGKVTKEVFADEIPLGPRPDYSLPDEYAEAFAAALEKLWRGGAAMEDVQLANFFFRTVEYPDGRPPKIECGLSDPDRLDWFKNPRKHGGLDSFLSSIESDPHGEQVLSRDPGGDTLNSAEEAMLAFLEHRGFLTFLDPPGAFISKWVPFDTLKKHFDNLRQYPGQSSELAPELRNLVPFPGPDGPRWERLAARHELEVIRSFRLAA